MAKMTRRRWMTTTSLSALAMAAGCSERPSAVNAPVKVASPKSPAPKKVARPRPQLQYDVRPLGEPGPQPSYAMAVSPDGSPVGHRVTAQSVHVACIWEGKRVVDLSTPGGPFALALAIDGGRNPVIVGEARGQNGTDLLAFRWQGGRVQPLPTDADFASRACGVNAQGIAVGCWSSRKESTILAVCWEQPRVSKILARPSDLDHSQALAINKHGSIVGSIIHEGSSRAVIWHDLGSEATSLSLPENRTSIALAVNDNRQVVGSMSIAGDIHQHAFLWSEASFEDLGKWTQSASPANFNGTSVAMAVNHDGHAVGFATTAKGVDLAVLWRDEHFLDLNELIDPQDRQTWVLSYARGIDDEGRIVGVGHMLQASKERVPTAFIATPRKTVVGRRARRLMEAGLA